MIECTHFGYLHGQKEIRSRNENKSSPNFHDIMIPAHGIGTLGMRKNMNYVASHLTTFNILRFFTFTFVLTD